MITLKVRLFFILQESDFIGYIMNEGKATYVRELYGGLYKEYDRLVCVFSRFHVNFTAMISRIQTTYFGSIFVFGCGLVVETPSPFNTINQFGKFDISSRPDSVPRIDVGLCWKTYALTPVCWICTSTYYTFVFCSRHVTNKIVSVICGSQFAL